MRLRSLVAVAAATTVLALPLVAGAEDRTPRVPTPPPTCTLTVPAHPLTAVGLATPYQLNGCDQADSNLTAFVQAAIISPAGAISVYGPLVENAGVTPPVAPVVPVIAPGSTVALWFGFNGDVLHLVGPGAGGCVNGLFGSDFGQYSYCNAPAFFFAANAAIRRGQLVVPPLGRQTTGAPCLSVRSFAVVDQDQSDNVQTQYLKDPTTGLFIQNTALNKAAFPADVVVSNPSDNRLLTAFIDPATGCSAWSAPNLADPGAMVNALALNELQAAADQAAPVALVPLGDPMALYRGSENLFKTILYRLGVDQPFFQNLTDKFYCTNLATVFPAFMKANQSELEGFKSPVPAAGANLWLFLGARFTATYDTLMLRPCVGVTGTPDPVTVTYDLNGTPITVTVQ